MELSPDAIVFWRWGPVSLNSTILNTWIIMGLLAAGSWWVTRNLSSGPQLTPGQNVLETVVIFFETQIREITGKDLGQILPFVGTLFLFIATAALLSVVPGYSPPTGSLSTTAALAACVFIAVPLMGIAHLGFLGYLRRYVQPSIIMLPFHIIGEFSRTLALAVRLFGNVMSGNMIVTILLAIVPLFFPLVMQLLGLLISFIQAYIFAVLATVFIAAAMSDDAS